MRGVQIIRATLVAMVLAINFGFLVSASQAATQTQSSSTTVNGVVKQVDCLGNTINNPSQIIYPYPIVCEATVDGAVLVEPNFSNVIEEETTSSSSSSRIRSRGPFGAVLNVIGINGAINTTAVMTVAGVTVLLSVFVVLRAMGLISTRGLGRFFLKRPRLK